MDESRSSPGGNGGHRDVDDITLAIHAALVPAEESQIKTESAEEIIDLEKANARLTYQNRLTKKQSRKWWNRILLTMVVFGFAASYVLIFLIGFGVLDFGDSSLAVPAVVAASVVETYGLAKLAIKYFFDTAEAPEE